MPNVEGIVLEAGRLWAVQNFGNQVSHRLRPDLSSGIVEKVITSPWFRFSTIAAALAVAWRMINAKFDTGLAPTADRYDQRSVLPQWEGWY